VRQLRGGLHIRYVRTRELAEQIVRRHAGALADHAQRPTDPEAIHQARVATRRLRAALRVFKGALPAEAEPVKDELTWIARQLGAVRDLDVQIERLQTNAAQLDVAEAVVPHAVWLGTQRQQALSACAEALESARFASLGRNLEELTPGSLDEDEPVKEYAPRTLRQVAKKLRKRADALDRRSPDADFHQVRIRAKRLRYTCEFFEPLYDKSARKLIDACTDLQDLLGDQQDGIVATRRIHEAIQSAAAAWPAEAVLALGQVVQWEAEHRGDIRRRFKPTYAKVDRAWRRLRNAL
jgi:triphosphatase